MIHGVYVKNKPKSKWRLVSIAASPEVANNEILEFQKIAKLEGNDNAEVAVQSFDSGFYIPESLSEITTPKILYN